MSKFLSILLLMTVAACAVAIGLGFYLGWFATTTHPAASGDGKVVVAFEVDTDKIKADTKTAREGVEKATDAVKDKIQDLSGTTVQGIMNVDATAQTFTLLTSDGKELSLHMAPNAEVRLKNKDKDGDLKDLSVGDQVTVVYKSEDGKNLARSITAAQGT